MKKEKCIGCGKRKPVLEVGLLRLCYPCYAFWEITDSKLKPHDLDSNKGICPFCEDYREDLIFDIGEKEYFCPDCLKYFKKWDWKKAVEADSK